MFWREKHTRVFLMQLLCIACLGITAALLSARLQENRVAGLLFEHDARLASSLLEQGVPKQTAAQAIAYAREDTAETAADAQETAADGKENGRESIAEMTGKVPDARRSDAPGEVLLGQLGLERGGTARRMPSFHAFCTAERMRALSAALFFLLLFGTVLWYLQKRDRIYREAIAAIENCGQDDFSLKLPELYDGTLYQLFSRINFMAAMLKTRQETENRVKEFLKATVSDISHQLKTPLAALSMYQEILRNESEQAETVALFAEKSKAALTRMEGLIQVLLKITRLDAGSVAFFKKEFDAKELVLEAQEELTTRAEREGKEILLSGDEGAGVYCDPEWSREALGNLIKNALDHTGRGDQIRIAWEQTPLMTRFTVADNGEGIEKEDLPHIFKRFYRCENSRNRQGTGLGLSLVKSIADGQGGTVSVESEPGRGSLFVLAFPNRQKQ